MNHVHKCGKGTEKMQTVAKPEVLNGVKESQDEECDAM
jgi:hypothetical protein